MRAEGRFRIQTTDLLSPYRRPTTDFPFYASQMLINVTQCLGEMCIMYPVSGGFYTLAIRFLDEGFGVSLGYNYLLRKYSPTIESRSRKAVAEAESTRFPSVLAELG